MASVYDRLGLLHRAVVALTYPLVRVGGCAFGVGTISLGHAQGLSSTYKFPAHQELIVTGEKYARTLQETPTSVAIIATQAIKNENLLNVYDVLDRTPNLVSDGTRTSFSIRGVDAFNVTGAGDGPLATVYVDGAPVPRLALASGPLDLFDIAQVEIFRGPQSTLQGRNSLAGSIIVSSVEPGFDWTGNARLLLIGRTGQRRAGAAVGGPIIDDELAFRVSAEVSGTDGLIRNVTISGNADRESSAMVRGKILLTPSNAPGLRVVATLFRDRHRRGTFYNELDPPYALSDRISLADVQDVKQVTSSIGTVEAEYELTPNLQIVSVSNYSRIQFRSVSDANRVAAPDQIARISDVGRTFQQEVRLRLSHGRIDGLVGMFLLNEDRAYAFSATQNLGLVSLGVDRQLRAAGLSPESARTVIDLYGGVLAIRNDLQQPISTENYAGFADVTFHLGGGLRVHAGLRYDTERQKRRAMQSVAINRALPDPATLAAPELAQIVSRLNVILAGLVQGASSMEPSRTVRYDAWLPKVGLTYEPSDNVSLSAMVQRGYRAGGSGFNQQRAQLYDYDPEHTMNYELAVRSIWFDNRFVLNANAYRAQWKKQQVLVQLTPGSLFDTQVVNLGRSALHGFEVEGRAAVGRVALYGGIGYARTVIKDAGPASTTGTEFPRAPRWTVSGGATFAHPCGWFANLNANYRSAYYQYLSDQRRRDIPDRMVVNAKIGWQGRHFGGFLIASNIFNTQKIEQFFRDVDARRRGTLNAARTLGLSFEGRF